MTKKRDHSAPGLDITVAYPTTYYNQLPQHALCTIPSTFFKQQHYTTSLNNKLQTVEDMVFPDNLLQLPQSFRANEGKDRRHKFSAVGREPFLHAYNKEPPMDTVTWKSMGYLDDNGHNTIMPLLKL